MRSRRTYCRPPSLLPLVATAYCPWLSVLLLLLLLLLWLWLWLFLPLLWTSLAGEGRLGLRRERASSS